jgi:hypothetical protein
LKTNWEKLLKILLGFITILLQNLQTPCRGAEVSKMSEQAVTELKLKQDIKCLLSTKHYVDVIYLVYLINVAVVQTAIIR